MERQLWTGADIGYRGGVSHLFVGPHPDDVALSCGGLVASLAEAGETVELVTVFCEPGAEPELTAYQKEALGFGDRGSLTPQAAMAERRAEDEAFARSAGALLRSLGLPDGVFRGYALEGQLMNAPRPDDPPPTEAIRAVIRTVDPEFAYFPLAIGGHVDHRLVRRAGLALAVELGDRLAFYEDFPYMARGDFESLDQLEPSAIAALPEGSRLEPWYFELGAFDGRKMARLQAYPSQLAHMFAAGELETLLTGTAERIGRLGGVGPAERYWRVVGP